MKCQKCDQPASVHWMEWSQGRQKEYHLCARCAEKEGVPNPSANSRSAMETLEKLVYGLIQAHVGSLAEVRADAVCPWCGASARSFLETGRLGCPADYDHFLGEVLEYLPRHQPGSRHVGKRPRYWVRDQTRLALRTQIRRAVADENYELAAELRDRLRQKDSRI